MQQNNRFARNNRRPEEPHVVGHAFAKIIGFAGIKALIQFSHFSRNEAKCLVGITVPVGSDLRHASLITAPEFSYLVKFAVEGSVPGKLSSLNKGDEIAVFTKVFLPHKDGILTGAKPTAQQINVLSWATMREYNEKQAAAKKERTALQEREQRLSVERELIYHLNIPSAGIDLMNDPANLSTDIAIAGLEVVDGAIKDAPEDIIFEVLGQVSGEFEKIESAQFPFLPKPNPFMVNRRRPSGGINGAANAFAIAEEAGENGATEVASETPAEVSEEAAPSAPEKTTSRRSKKTRRVLATA